MSGTGGLIVTRGWEKKEAVQGSSILHSILSGCSDLMMGDLEIDG